MTLLVDLHYVWQSASICMLERILVDKDPHPAPVTEMHPVLPALQVFSQAEASRKFTSLEEFLALLARE